MPPGAPTAGLVDGVIGLVSSLAQGVRAASKGAGGMSWLTNVVRPKLRELVGARREVPDNLWQTCPTCAQMIFHRDLEKNLHVCQHCGHHLRLGVEERLAMLLDEGWRRSSCRRRRSIR